MPGRLRNEVEYSSAIDDKQEEDEERSSYYGGASVPFIWESQPGTPKHNLFPDSSFPMPLTPPPSFYSGILSTPKRQSKVRTKLTRLLSMSLFTDLRKSSSNSSKKTTNNDSRSSFSFSSTSSSSSFSSSPVLYANYKEDETRSSPTSTLCYSNGGRKGFSSSIESMRKALFAVPRHGSTNKALIINNMSKA